MEVVQRSRRAMKLFSSVDSTAFASILVVLVFTVWVFQGMSYNPHQSVSVDVPKVSHPVAMRGALREDAMKVSILRDGQVYFGGDRVWSGDLAQKIQDRLKDRDVERKVYIMADMRARWSTVKMVLEGVRSAGIIRVAFLADQRRFPSLTR
jgi:biopolymer transport protein ExbD